MKQKSEHTEVGIIVGRFQTNELHEAHVDLIETVLKQHARVIIFLGLSPLRVTHNNPLDFESRKQMLIEKFGNQVTVLYIKDVNDDELWSTRLDAQIDDVIGPTQKVTLYGGRDSFIRAYHGKYPAIELESDRIISSSEVRKKISAKVKASPDFRAGVIWASQNQYPKAFTTVDIAIFSEDRSKILLARKPDEKLYRFVGGFSTPNSASFEEDARREVAEEAGIEVSAMRYIASMKVDDWRYRGETDKIKTILFATTYVFGGPKASDDVAEVRWFPYRARLIDEIVPAHKSLFERLVQDGELHPMDFVTPTNT